MSYTSPLIEGNFDTILGLTIPECIAIYSNDGWFTGEADDPKRYVKLTLEDSNLTVALVKNDKPAEGNFKDVTKAKYTELEGNEIGWQQLTNLAFSVNGNKGPFETFKKGRLDKAEDYGGTQLKYLAHHAWFIHNEWTINDPVVQAVVKKQLGEFGKFTGVYFETYKALVESDMDPKLATLVDLDLNRAKVYLKTLQESSSQASGGSRSKSAKKSQKRKSKKSKKRSTHKKH